MQEHRSFPSIVTYIVFNEGWGQYPAVLRTLSCVTCDGPLLMPWRAVRAGQYETERVTALAKSLDASRLFTPASGWVDAQVRQIST